MEHTRREAYAFRVIAVAFLMITLPATAEGEKANNIATLKSHYKVGAEGTPEACLGEVTVLNPPRRKGVGRAIVVHGLNNNTIAMEEIEKTLSKMFYVEHLQLPGHGSQLCQNRDMKADWLSAYDHLVQRGDTPPSVSVGYSLGGLIIATQAADPTVLTTPKKLILIAPAIRLNYTRVPLHIGTYILPDALSLPSYTPEEYMAFKSIPVSYYVGLRDLQSSLNQSVGTLSQRQIPALILLNKQDRLISFARTETFLSRSNLSNWIIRPVTPAADTKFHDSHLIINEDSIGSGPWQQMKSEIYNFLEITD